ncbi:IS110 family transposase [Fimbriiglobus ruber]|nr:IS110 family transposase [Fimbriiglobus ruber]
MAELVACTRESAGRVKGVGGRKIGNAHLKWAFSEAASLMPRSFPAAKSWMQRQSQKRDVKKTHAILEAKIGRTVYHLWRKQVAFDPKKFLAS